jgi:integrase
MKFPQLPLTGPNIRTLIDLQQKAGVPDHVHFDQRLPGFGIRIRAFTGAHTFMVQYAIGGRSRRLVLGRWGRLDPGKAYKAAQDMLVQKRLGGDPAGEKAARIKQAGETFKGLLPGFLERQKAKLRPNSYRETARYLLDAAKPLHSLPVASIDRRAAADLLARVEKVSGKPSRNRCRAACHTYFHWLMLEGRCDTNPFGLTAKAIENAPRDRVLTDEEIRTIWAALDDDAADYHAILKLLLLTAARRDEVGSLDWSEVDFETGLITIAATRTKGRRPHVIPITAPVRALLEARAQRAKAEGSSRALIFGRGFRGFSGWSKAKHALDAAIAAKRGAPLSGWTLHDFRRVASTVMHERLGVQPHIVESILAHHSGHKAGVAGVYNKSLYLSERARALELWAAHVLHVVTGVPAVVVALRPR